MKREVVVVGNVGVIADANEKPSTIRQYAKEFVQDAISHLVDNGAIHEHDGVAFPEVEVVEDMRSLAPGMSILSFFLLQLRRTGSPQMQAIAAYALQELAGAKSDEDRAVRAADAVAHIVKSGAYVLDFLEQFRSGTPRRTTADSARSTAWSAAAVNGPPDKEVRGA